MNQVVVDAINIAYKYASALNFVQDMSSIERTLMGIAGVSEFSFLGQLSFAPLYEDVQSVLSKINERESIRKSKGVYYTPLDGKSDKKMRNTSKFISLILRHKPEVIGITLDEHGWADVRELIEGINHAEGHYLDMEMLEEIVRTDEKQRYSFNEDHTLIRTNQGHSIPVDVELEERTPPDILWHGTGEKYVSAIDEQGLIPKSRLYVHLSADLETARKVGSRHGRPVIYQVNCGQMVQDGFRFFLSANKVWLTKEVPVRYLSKLG